MLSSLSLSVSLCNIYSHLHSIPSTITTSPCLSFPLFISFAFSSSLPTHQANLLLMEQQVPAFAGWEFLDGLPINYYLESARRAGGHCCCCFEEEDKQGVDLYKLPTEIAGVYRRNKRKVKRQEQQGFHISKAVDEDLYKIPPELLIYQKPPIMKKKKNKMARRSLWSGCLGLSCIP